MNLLLNNLCKPFSKKKVEFIKQEHNNIHFFALRNTSPLRILKGKWEVGKGGDSDKGVLVVKEPYFCNIKG